MKSEIAGLYIAAYLQEGYVRARRKAGRMEQTNKVQKLLKLLRRHIRKEKK